MASQTVVSAGSSPDETGPLAAITIPSGSSIAVAPVLRYRVWRYAVREDEIDLRHGWWAVTRTIVPTDGRWFYGLNVENCARRKRAQRKARQIERNDQHAHKRLFGPGSIGDQRC